MSQFEITLTSIRAGDILFYRNRKGKTVYEF